MTLNPLKNLWSQLDWLKAVSSTPIDQENGSDGMRESTRHSDTHKVGYSKPPKDSSSHTEETQETKSSNTETPSVQSYTSPKYKRSGYKDSLKHLAETYNYIRYPEK